MDVGHCAGGVVVSFIADDCQGFAQVELFCWVFAEHGDEFDVFDADLFVGVFAFCLAEQVFAHGYPCYLEVWDFFL